MTKENNIDIEKLKRMYELGLGIPGVRHRYKHRVFYPMKPRTCKNCFLLQYTFGGIPIGCYVFETKRINGTIKPAGLCIPVKGRYDLLECHSEKVLEWIEKNLRKEKSL